MRNEILAVLQEIRPDIDYDVENRLIDDGVLESFDVVSIVAQLEDVLQVIIEPEFVIAENFNSLDALCRLVEKIK